MNSYASVTLQTTLELTCYMADYSLRSHHARSSDDISKCHKWLVGMIVSFRLVSGPGKKTMWGMKGLVFQR